MADLMDGTPSWNESFDLFAGNNSVFYPVSSWDNVDGQMRHGRDKGWKGGTEAVTRYYTWEGDRKKPCSRQAEKMIVIRASTESYRNTLFWINVIGVRSICASVLLASYLRASKPRTGEQDRGKSSKPLVICSFSNFVRAYVQWYGGFRANHHWHHCKHYAASLCLNAWSSCC